ncbi:hypothetical protein KSS87_009602 [Heliosperma pusillum]|nr:hypothetical protein KSS87_009602 [Heliosperma pusillum]
MYSPTERLVWVGQCWIMFAELEPNPLSSGPMLGWATYFFSVGTRRPEEVAALTRPKCDNGPYRVMLGQRQVHGRLIKLGVLNSNAVVGNKLVVAYSSKAGFLGDARKVFDEIPKREVSGFAALIGGLCKLEKWVDVFSMLEMMVNDGMLPDRFLVPRILKACSAMEVGRVGRMVHGFVLRRGMDEDVFLGNALIDMYANCGDLRSSRTVFDTMSERDVVSWTALVVAYMDRGLVDEAVGMFRRMESDGEQGDLISWNALVFGFAHNGEIELALGTIAEMEQKGLKAYVNTWNGIIAGCSHSGYYEDAIDAYVKLFSSSLTPNTLTIVSILPACSGLEDLELGQVIHGHAIKLGLCGNIHIDGSLIGMYWKCDKTDSAESIFLGLKDKNSAICNEMIAAYTGEGNVDAALELFRSMKVVGPKPDEITYNTILAAYIRDDKKSETYELLSEMLEMGLHPNVVTFNIIISGYQQSGHNIEALSFFQAMQSPNSGSVQSVLMRKSIQPNSVTVTSALAACADLGSLRHGRELHGYVLRNGFESSCFVAGALVDMYSKCYEIDSAAEVFWRTKDKNTIMWNTLIAGYINTGGVFEAFALFDRMLEEKFEPSCVTFNILLSACGEVGALRLGREIHGYLLKRLFDDSSKLFLTSALIDMYAKCGSIREATWVFDLETCKDNAVWNAMILSFSAHGMTKNAVALFEQMETSGIVPDGKTFTALLSACARDGLILQGRKYFTLMSTNFGISPSLEHYTCMVALMGTVGLLDEALEFIREMPFNPDACIWSTLLRSCKTHSNPEIGEQAARALFELEPENPSNYILLSNIYASSGLWDSWKDLRKFVNNMKSMTVKECSYISIGSTLHSFARGRVFSPLLNIALDTWHKLAEEMRIAGHSVQNPILGTEDNLDPCSCSHTEKLAISLGIVSLSNSQPIRVSKNLRMCFDCHKAAKLISKNVGREIFVKDVSFFHHMKNGTCSCQDRW